MEREPESHYEEIPANSPKKPKTKKKRASPKASSEKHVYETPTKPKFGAKRVAPQMETKAQSKPKVQKRSNSPKTKPRKLNVKMGVSYKENEYDNKQVKSQPAPITQITAETQLETETSNYNQLQMNEITSQEGVATSEHTSSNPSDQTEWQPLRTMIKNILGERFPDDWSKPSWITYFEEQDEIYASADRRLQEELINTTDAEDENDMRQSTSTQELPPLKDDELSIWTILKNKLGDRFPRRWKGMRWQMYMDEEDIKQGVKIVAKFEEESENKTEIRRANRTMPPTPISPITQFEEDYEDPRAADAKQQRTFTEFLEINSLKEYHTNTRWIETTQDLQERLCRTQNRREKTK